MSWFCRSNIFQFSDLNCKDCFLLVQVFICFANVFSHRQVVSILYKFIFFWSTQKKIFWKILVTKHFLVPTDFHSIFLSFYRSRWLPTTVGYQHSSKYFVQHKKEGHKVLEQFEGEEMTTYFLFNSQQKIIHLKGLSDAHFPLVDMILYGFNEKSKTYFGLNFSMVV